MSRNISSFFIEHNIIDAEDLEVYEYSFEILLSTLLNLLAVVVIAFISGTALFTFLYLMGFIPLRLFAGGYHAKNHLRCFAILIIAYLAFLAIAFFFPVEYMLAVIIPSIILSIVIVFFLAPSEDKNNPISSENLIRLKRKSRIVIFGYAVIVSILLATVPDKSISLSIALGFFTVSLSLLANHIKCKRSKQK